MTRLYSVVVIIITCSDTAGWSHTGDTLVFSGGYITRSITFIKFEVVVKEHFDDVSALKFLGIKFIFTLMWLLFR